MLIQDKITWILEWYNLIKKNIIKVIILGDLDYVRTQQMVDD